MISLSELGHTLLQLLHGFILIEQLQFLGFELL